MKGLSVIKVGGAVLEEERSMKAFLGHFSALAGPKVLVHGGGRTATRVAGSLGIETRMVGGRRVTDGKMLEVVTMVYGGLVNRRVVAALQSLGTDAVGLTGADMGVVLARKRPPVEVDGVPVDYGFVGDVISVDSGKLRLLLREGLVPVMAPLTCDSDGNILNTNADTIASSIASAMAREYDVTLTFCFEKAGVLDSEGRPLARIDREVYEKMKESGAVSGGMVPKLDNAFDALTKGVTAVRITDSVNLTGGTLIYG